MCLRRSLIMPGRMLGSRQMTLPLASRFISASSVSPPGSGIRLMEPKCSAWTDLASFGRSRFVSMRPAELSSKKE